VVRPRYWRPYPTEELRTILKDVKGVAVLDFSYSYGSPDHAGAFYNELRSALYDSPVRPVLSDFLFLGGREPSIEHFEKAVRITKESVEEGKASKLVWWLTLRGEDS